MALYTLNPITKDAYQLGVEGCARIFDKSYHLSTAVDYLIHVTTSSIPIKKAIYDKVRKKVEFVIENDQLITIPTFIKHEDQAVLLLKTAYKKLEEIMRNLTKLTERRQDYDKPTAVVNKEEWLWRARLLLLEKVYEILGIKMTDAAKDKKGFFVDLPTQWGIEELTKFYELCTITTHSIEDDIPNIVLSFVDEIPDGYIEVEPYENYDIEPTLRSLMVVDTSQLFNIIMNTISTIVDNVTDVVIDLENRKVEVFSNEKYDLTSYLL